MLRICAVVLTLLALRAHADELFVPGQFATIQAAINAAMPGDVVTIAPGTYREALDTLGKAITLRSTDPADPSVVAMTVLSGDTDEDGIGDVRIVSAISGETPATTLDGLTLTMGRAEFGPAVLADQSSITVRRCSVIANESTSTALSRIGGALATLTGEIVAEDCTFDNNRCHQYPRDIYANAGTITATGCDFRTTDPISGADSYAIRATAGGTLSVLGCTFVDLDGAIYASTIDECIIDTCIFDNNTTSLITVLAPVITMSNSTVKNCGPEETTFESLHVAVRLYGASDLLIENCQFIDNTFDNFSGALEAFNSGTIRDCVFARNTNSGTSTNFSNCGIVGGMTIERCLFEDNAGAAVGAIELTQGNGYVRECVFRNNSGTELGTFFVGSTATLFMQDCEFIRNRVESVNGSFATGGGISFIEASSKKGYIRRTKFISNHATNAGGAIFFSRPLDPCFIDDCDFYGNTTDFQGGAIHAYERGGLPSVTNSAFVDNTAGESGGAILSWNRGLVANNTFVNNSAPVGPTHRHTGGVVSFINNLITTEELKAPQLVYSGTTSGVIVSHSIIPGGYTGPGASTAIIDLTPVLTRLPDDGGDGWGDDPATPGVDESLNDDYGDLTPISVEAIDAGSNAALPIDRYDFDIDGDTTDPISIDGASNLRFVDIASVADTGPGEAPIVDIGAIEVQTMPCLADTNHDGMLTPADFTAWIAAFNAMAHECDQNGDMLCTPADFTAWIANYNAGC